MGPQFSPLQKGLSLLLLIRTTVGVTSHLITWWCSENRTSTLWGRWGTHWPGCSDCYYSRYCRLTGDHESNQTCLSGGSCEGFAAVKWDHKALWHLGMCDSGFFHDAAVGGSSSETRLIYRWVGQNNVTILIKMLIVLTVSITAKKVLAGLTSIMMCTMVHN